MITLWSIVCAIIAGIDLGYSLGYFIKQHNIENGMFWLVLGLVMVYCSISSIVKRGRQIRYLKQMQQQAEEAEHDKGEDE